MTAEMLIDGDVWPELQRVAARKSRSSALVVVPYVSRALLELRAGDTLVVDVSPGTLGAGLTDPTVLLAYQVAGVAIHRSPALHAKVFVLGNVAAVGSANMSGSSEERLREAVLLVRDAATVKAIREAAWRFAEDELTKDDLTRLVPLYRPPRGSSLPKRPTVRHPAGPPATVEDRLWVVGLTSGVWPASARQTAAGVWRGVRRRAGRVSDVEVGSAYFSAGEAPTFAIDDRIIEVWSPSNVNRFGKVLYPAQVTDVVPVRGRGMREGAVIAYWRRPAGTEPRSWADLKSAAKTASARLPEQLGARLITNRAVRAAVLNLWRGP